MPELHVTQEDGDRHIPFAPALSVREILETTDLSWRSACGGFGACGLCLIQIEAGNVGDPTANELINLSPEQIQRGIRLACQIRPRQDMRTTREPS